MSSKVSRGSCRAPLYGAISGYVKIPEGHHWHGLDYDAFDVDVHGGLTGMAAARAAGWASTASPQR